MRKIYFIRHAHPDIPLDERWCLGSGADLPLNNLGKLQGRILAEAFRDIPLAGVYSSTMIRARQTAAYLSKDYVVFQGLEEIYMGCWDGLPFSQIMEQYPEDYAKREADRSIQPPGAESIEAAKERFSRAVTLILALTQGDIAIVAHAGILSFFFGQKLAHTAYMVTDEKMNILEGPILPHVELSPELCRSLREEIGLLPHISQHCDAVAEEALKYCDALETVGVPMNRALVEQASLLHDIVRLEKNHEELGGRYLSKLGYPDIGDVIRQHCSPDAEIINEAAVLFMADKNIREDAHVSVEERFGAVYRKCESLNLLSDSFLEAYHRRLNEALRFKELFNRTCGQELVK